MKNENVKYGVKVPLFSHFLWVMDTSNNVELFESEKEAIEKASSMWKAFVVEVYKEKE